MTQTQRRVGRERTVKRPTKSTRDMRAAFDDLVRRNPRVARTMLTLLEIVAEDRRRAVRLLETMAGIVAA